MNVDYAGAGIIYLKSTKKEDYHKNVWWRNKPFIPLLLQQTNYVLKLLDSQKKTHTLFSLHIVYILSANSGIYFHIYKYTVWGNGSFYINFLIEWTPCGSLYIFDRQLCVDSQDHKKKFSHKNFISVHIRFFFIILFRTQQGFILFMKRSVLS